MPSIGCSPKMLLLIIIIIAIVAVVVYLLSRGSGDGTEGQSNLPTTATTGLVTPGSFGSTTTTGSSSTVVTSISQQARAKRTVLKGNGNDRATVMV